MPVFRTAIVTGTTSGIGLSVARALAEAEDMGSPTKRGVPSTMDTPGQGIDDPECRPSPLPGQMGAAGCLGRRTGKGLAEDGAH